MRPLVVVILILVAVAVLVFALSGNKEEGTGVGPTGGSPTAKPDPTPAPDPLKPAGTGERVSTPTQPADPGAPAVATLARDNALIGFVLTDPDRKPLPDAKVKLAREPMAGEALGVHTMFSNKPLTGIHRTATTDQKGQYVFKGLEPANDYYLFASHTETTQVQFDHIVVGEAGDSHAPDILLGAGSTLSGFVRDEGQGSAVPQAQVHLDSPYMFDGSVKSPDRLSAESDGTGYYVIRNIPGGQRSLTVEAEGYGTLTMQGSVPEFAGRAGDNKEKDVALSPAAPLGGKVIGPKGEPIRDAKVIALMFQNDRSCRGESVSDENGEFMIQGLMPGSYILQVDAACYRPQRVTRVTAGDLAVQIELIEKGQLAGRVTDGTAPVTAFTCAVLRTSPNPTPGTMQIFENTGIVQAFEERADGRFELCGFDPQSYAIRVTAPGFAPTTSGTFTVALGQPIPELAIRMTRGGTIKGRVVDAGGAPVSNAVITSRDNASADVGVDPLFGNLLASAVTEKTARSNVEGYFEISQLAAGVYLLQVEHPRFTAGMAKDLNLIEGATLDAGTVTLRAGGSVGGTVRNASGQTVARAIVNLLSTAQTAVTYQTRTDAQGRYEFEHVRPGNYRLQAMHGAGHDPFGDIGDAQTSEVQVPVSEGVPVKRDLNIGN